MEVAVLDVMFKTPMWAAPEMEVEVPDPVIPRVEAVRPFVTVVEVPAPVTETVVKVPAAAVEPPITTLSKVEVETERPVAVPAEEMSQALELMTIASPLSPMVTAPVKVWSAFKRATFDERDAS